MKTVIETQRMILRPFTAEDADDIWPCMTAELSRYMLWETPKKAEDFKQIWQNWQAIQEEGNSYVFVGRMKNNGSLIGLFSAHNFTAPVPRLALWVCEGLQRQGYASEALKGIMHWVGQHFQPDYFSYQVAEQNVASRKLVESLGGKAVGVEEDPKFTLIIYHIPA